MKVLVTGATGFIGRALVPHLLHEGHQVVVWARSVDGARNALGADVEIVSARAGLDALTAAVSRCDAVVNLAGEPILGKRWTAARRQALEQSRVGVTADLVRAMAAAPSKPRVLVSGSAVGIYGDRAGEVLTETSAPGDDFLAGLCQRWEAAAQAARALGVRVVTVRTGVVLGRGGALAQMLPPFKLGAGGPVGSGRQYFPWIHLLDMVRLLAVAIVDDGLQGPVNGVAPEEATSRTFATALGRALHRPAFLPLPAFVLRLIFGEAAVVLLASQRATPRALLDRGFRFAFPTLDAALRDIVDGAPVDINRASAQAPDDPADRAYLAANRPTFELRASTIVNAPLQETFAFFSRAENLGLLTPPSMAFTILNAPAAVTRGTTIDYKVSVGPVRLAWRTLINSWETGRQFVDVQQAGPYRVWWHQHAFRADGDRTVMEDRVCYTPPFGPIGRLANRFFIAPTLRAVFQYRHDVIRLRFGVAPSAG